MSQRHFIVCVICGVRRRVKTADATCCRACAIALPPGRWVLNPRTRVLDYHPHRTKEGTAA